MFLFPWKQKHRITILLPRQQNNNKKGSPFSIEPGCLWFDFHYLDLFRLNIYTLFLYFCIQMPIILFHEVKHTIKLFLGYLLKYGFISLLKLFMQVLMDFIDYFPLLRKPKIDFFLVIRLLVAFDNAFFMSFLVILLMAPLVI